MRPPVLVIGAQRCATTYLYRVLDAHPSVRMARPERPEPKWFLSPAAEGATGADWRRALFSDDAAADAGVLLGEKSTSYLESDTAAARVTAALPDAHLLVSLRDPVERALSNYRFSVVNGVETRAPAEALLSGEEPEWDPGRFSVSPYDYLGRSRYLQHLRRWQDVGARLRLVLAEQLLAEDAALHELLDDLGLDRPSRSLRPAGRVNAAAGPEIDPVVVEGVRERLADSTAALVDQFDLPFARWWPSVA